jgi:hypothetical protein
MASEKEANLARERYSDFLRKHGAHAISVDQVRYRERTFVVVAFFAKKPANLPTSLEVTSGKTNLKVPLVARYGKIPTRMRIVHKGE